MIRSIFEDLFLGLQTKPKRIRWRQLTEKIKITKKGCWEWQGNRVPPIVGYGACSYSGKQKKVHRLFMEFLHGEIPGNMVVDHLCNNPPCCNPEHLEIVSRWENTRRSNSQFAINSRKTHCIRGHLLEGENVLVGKKDNHRRCLTCHRESRRKYRLLHLDNKEYIQKNRERAKRRYYQLKQEQENYLAKMNEKAKEYHEFHKNDPYYAENRKEIRKKYESREDIKARRRERLAQLMQDINYRQAYNERKRLERLARKEKAVLIGR